MSSRVAEVMWVCELPTKGNGLAGQASTHQYGNSAALPSANLHGKAAATSTDEYQERHGTQSCLSWTPVAHARTGHYFDIHLQDARPDLCIKHGTARQTGMRASDP